MKRINKLSEIPKRNYEGYVWLSYRETPIVLREEKIDFSKYEEGNNPFIAEALLFDRDTRVSVMVRHTGRYHIHEFDLNNLSEGTELEDVEYLPHRLNRVKKVCFKQLWLPEEDENCEGWLVLKMKALVFTGFKTKN